MTVMRYHSRTGATIPRNLPLGRLREHGQAVNSSVNAVGKERVRERMETT